MDKRKHSMALILFVWCLALLPSPLSSAALPTVLASSMTTAATPAAATLPTPGSKDTSFNEAVEQWIQSLAKEPSYSTWKQATWTSYPLGPGTHGWIVLVQADNKDIGYMVIHAADPHNPQQYQLTEYGSGGNPLFSMQTLYHSLVQLELIHTSHTVERWYTDPMHAVWIIQSNGRQYVLDAKTGEQLPCEATSLLRNSSLHPTSMVTLLLPEHIIIKSLQLPPFDPYKKLPWVHGNPLVLASFEELAGALQLQSQLTFTAELYNGHALIALPVIGFQQWSNQEAFLTLEQEGLRSIPYPVAARFGKLFN